MSTLTWRRIAEFLIAALASGGAGAATVDATPVVQQACAAIPDTPDAPVDLDALNQRFNAGQAAGTSAGLAEACMGWRQVSRDPASLPSNLTDWHAKVAASLVWLRSADAEPLMASLYEAYAAAGYTQVYQAGMTAGMTAGMLAAIWRQRGELDTALRWSQRAVEAMDHEASIATATEALRLRLNHGALLVRARRYEEARVLLLSLLAEAQAQLDKLAAEAAAVLTALTTLARNQSQLPEALAYNEREIAFRQTHVTQNQVALANAMQQRGLLLLELAQFDAAEAALTQALQQAERARASGALDMIGLQAAVRANLSGLLLTRGRTADALKVALDAMAALAGSPRPHQNLTAVEVFAL